MASSPPPSTAAGVPPSGNGKFIAIAILLLLGVGAAIIWKVTQKPQEVVEKLDAAPPPPPSGRKVTDDDIPLPPEVPDAAVEDAGKKVVTNNGGDNGCGCAVKGTSTPELESAIQMRARQAHACYDQALAADSTLKGKVTVSLKIGASGQVCAASGQPSADLTNPNVAPCIAAKFRGNSFPAPKGGCVDIALPVNLTTAR